MNKKRIILILMLIVIVASTGVLIGRWSIVGAEGEGYEELKVFTEALSMVKKNYVEDVKTKDLVYGAIKGMLSSLDPHSSFLNPEAYKEMQTETKGEFGGIGIQIGVKEGMLTVIAPIEDTPAYRAGIKAGDKIIKINNELTKDMSLHDAVSKMRGVPKTYCNHNNTPGRMERDKGLHPRKRVNKDKECEIEDPRGWYRIRKDKSVPGTDSNRPFNCLGEAYAGEDEFSCP